MGLEQRRLLRLTKTARIRMSEEVPKVRRTRKKLRKAEILVQSRDPNAAAGTGASCEPKFSRQNVTPRGVQARWLKPILAAPEWFSGEVEMMSAATSPMLRGTVAFAYGCGSPPGSMPPRHQSVARQGASSLRRRRHE